jgi:hypothetical protein
MTPWQLSRIRDEEFDRAAAAGVQPPGGLTINDYKRAARFAREYFTAFQINFDIDTYSQPLGEEPTDAQLAALNTILNQILDMNGGAVRRTVTSAQGRGNRPLPRAAGTGAPTLRGKVRVWPRQDVRSRGQYMAKNYRLDRSIGVAPEGLDQLVTEELHRVGIQETPATSHITRQERLVTIFATAGAFAAGFYLPIEDIFYLRPGTSLDDPGVRSVARHEMAHMLGGAERTRDAFQNRYHDRYIPHWRSFEEGMAEIVRSETAPQAEQQAIQQGQSSGTVTTGEDPFYVAARERMNRLFAAAPGNRELLFNAYFTGNITEQVFRLLETIPPPPQ